MWRLRGVANVFGVVHVSVRQAKLVCWLSLVHRGEQQFIQPGCAEKKKKDTLLNKQWYNVLFLLGQREGKLHLKHTSSIRCYSGSLVFPHSLTFTVYKASVLLWNFACELHWKGNKPGSCGWMWHKTALVHIWNKVEFYYFCPHQSSDTHHTVNCPISHHKWGREMCRVPWHLEIYGSPVVS